MQSKILGVNNPLISIIIPVYNTAQYLRKCVDSVLAQTYKNLEIILVDDGSTDNSGSICDEYAKQDSRVKIIHQKNGGLSSARNKGIEQAHGVFLSFIDSDDWMDAAFIEILYQALARFNVQMVCAGYYWVEKTGIRPQSVLGESQTEKIVSASDALEMGFDGVGFFAWNKLYHHSLFAQIRFPEGKLFEDMATIYKVFLKADKVLIINRPLYYYNRTNLQSITQKQFSSKKLDYFVFSGEILSYAEQTHNDSLQNIIKQERAYHIAGFFRQMAQTHFEDTNIISPLQWELRQNIIKLLKSPHKLSNKLFALVCCVNFNWAASIYRKIGN